MKIILVTFSILAALLLNEWTIAYLKHSPLSSITIILIRIIDCLLVFWGILLFFTPRTFKFNRRIISVKKIFLFYTAISIPMMILISLELGLRTFYREGNVPGTTQEDLMATKIDFERTLGNNRFLKHAEVGPYKPYQSEHYYINRDGLKTHEFPISPDLDKWTIGVLGGSTVWGYNVANNRTIPGFIEQQLPNYKNKKFKIYNLGIEARKFPDEIKLLKSISIKKKIKFDRIVFYHGGNDFTEAYFYIMSGNKQLKTLEVKKTLLSLVIQKLSYFNLFQKFQKIVNEVMNQFNSDKKMKLSDAHKKRLNEVIKNYLNNHTLATKYCAEIKTPCDFFLQPLIFHKKNLSSTEKSIKSGALKRFPLFNTLYDQYAEGILSKKKKNIYDARNSFNRFEGTLFNKSDIIHISGIGNEMVARKIVEILKNEIYN